MAYARDRSTATVRAIEAELAARFPGSRVLRADREAGARARQILAAARGRVAPRPRHLGLDVAGTRFERRVWRQLLAVPPGTTTTYARLARAVGSPRACRAVGNAVGKNPIGILVPCHRVLRADGSLGGFAWGPRVKRALLAWEQTRT